jgi:hypothetical protein
LNPDLASLIISGTFEIGARRIPLGDVAAAWQDRDDDQRIVFTCGGPGGPRRLPSAAESNPTASSQVEERSGS